MTPPTRQQVIPPVIENSYERQEGPIPCPRFTLTSNERGESEQETYKSHEKSPTEEVILGEASGVTGDPMATWEVILQGPEEEILPQTAQGFDGNRTVTLPREHQEESPERTIDFSGRR